MKRLTVAMASALLLAAGGHLQGQIVIDQDTTIDYSTTEDVHIVAGLDPPTVVEVVLPGALRGHTRIYDSSVFTVSGGAILSMSAGKESGTHDCVITVDGSGFNYPYGPIPDASGTLTGTLASGDPISAAFEIYSDASIVLVPEPSSLVGLIGILVTAGLGYIRRRRMQAA